MIEIVQKGSKMKYKVYWWDPTDTYHLEREFDDPVDATEFALEFTRRPGIVHLGVARMVRVVDSEDMTNFEWKHGEGITYPTKEMLDQELKKKK